MSSGAARNAQRLVLLTQRRIGGCESADSILAIRPPHNDGRKLSYEKYRASDILPYDRITVQLMAKICSPYELSELGDSARLH